MKCKYCGGNLLLEGKFCPHCGRPNEEALQHAADMERYQDHFEETREAVYGVTKKFSGITARAVIIAVLTVAILIAYLLDDRAWSIQRWLLTMDANIHAKAYSNQLDRYLEEEDYLGFRYFCENHYIDGYDDKYQNYRPLIQAAYAYEAIYNSINNLLTAEDDRGLGSCISEIDYGYERFERNKLMDDYIMDDSTEETVRELCSPVFNRMELNLKILLRVYLGFTEEEAESFGELNRAERLFLLNRGCEEKGYGRRDE